MTTTGSQIKPGDEITGLSRGGMIGRGAVHTVSNGEFFVQLVLQGGARFNHYFKMSDEGITWVRGWHDDMEAVKAQLAAKKLVDSDDGDE